MLEDFLASKLSFTILESEFLIQFTKWACTRDWWLFIIGSTWRVIVLQYCVGFCHKSTCISHRYTYIQSLLNLPPHLTSLGCHRALGLSSLCHTANSHWLSVLHMVIYMFQCCPFISEKFWKWYWVIVILFLQISL